jgi:glycosyltransferase 2 family protein
MAPDSEGRRGHRFPAWLRIAVQAGLTVGVTFFLVDRLGVGVGDALAVGRALPDPRILPLGLSFPFLLGVFFLAASFWGRMARELGASDPGAWASFRIVMVANLGRYLPGKFWPLAGLALLARREGIPASTGSAAGVLIQGFSLGGAAVVALPALWIGAGGGRGDSVGLDTSAGAGLAAAGILLVLVSLASVPALTHRGLRLLFRAAGRDPAEAPRPAASFGPRWLLLHVILWCGYGVAFGLFLSGLGFDVPLAEAAPAFTAAYLLGYVALFAPAGIGIREGFLIAFLQPSLGGAAAAVAVLARVWMTVVELVPAGILAVQELLRTRATGMGKGGGAR